MTRLSYGWKVKHNAASGGPRGIIGEPERSLAGNLVLRAGRADGIGWHQTEHVVLTPEEAGDLFGRVAALLDPLVAVERGQVAREAIEQFIQATGAQFDDSDVARAAVDAVVRAVTVGQSV